MSILDRIRGTHALQEAREEIEELRTDLAIRADNMSLFQERLAELELHLEDEGWQVLGSGKNREFSRNGLRIINGLVRLYFLKNPLIRRAVLTQTQYVFGQGVNLGAKNALINEVVQEFWDNRQNKAELTEHQALTTKETELQLFANLFFVFFVNTFNGRVRVRTVPVDEITDIISNPEDAKDPWYYKRQWVYDGISPLTGQQVSKIFEAYYPDWRYKPSGGHPLTIGGIQVMKNSIYHVSVNRLSDMRFGVSEVYSGLDWARAYKEFLENWATIVKAHARFAWKISTKGGAAGVSSAKSKLESTLGTGTETNPAPATGSAFVATEGVKLDTIRTGGATTKAIDGRFLRLMVSSATGIFEHYLTGDPSTGNLATAKAMELPMLMMFRDRQQLWVSILTEILGFVVDQAVKAQRIPGTIEKDAYGEELIVLALDKDNEDETLRDKPIDRHIEVEFPNILDQVEDRVNAIVSAATLNGKPLAGTMELELISRLLLEALGIDNIDEILTDMFHNEEGGEGEEKPPDAQEVFVKEVRRMMEKLQEAIKQ